MGAAGVWLTEVATSGGLLLNLSLLLSLSLLFPFSLSLLFLFSLSFLIPFVLSLPLLISLLLSLPHLFSCSLLLTRLFLLSLQLLLFVRLFKEFLFPLLFLRLLVLFSLLLKILVSHPDHLLSLSFSLLLKLLLSVDPFCGILRVRCRIHLSRSFRYFGSLLFLFMFLLTICECCRNCPVFHSVAVRIDLSINQLHIAVSECLAAFLHLPIFCKKYLWLFTNVAVRQGLLAMFYLLLVVSTAFLDLAGCG